MKKNAKKEAGEISAPTAAIVKKSWKDMGQLFLGIPCSLLFPFSPYSLCVSDGNLTKQESQVSSEGDTGEASLSTEELLSTVSTNNEPASVDELKQKYTDNVARSCNYSRLV